MITIGPPSRTSTLMSEGRDGAGFGSLAGLMQLTVEPKSAANVIPRMKE